MIWRGKQPDIARVCLSQQCAEIIRLELGIGARQVLTELADRTIEPPQEVRTVLGIEQGVGSGRQRSHDEEVAKRPRRRARGRSRAGSASKWPIANDNTVRYSVIIMVRTQISLSEEEYAAAKREADRLGISLAELLRRSLRQLLPVDDSKPWMRFAGMVESGDSSSSQSIDDIVYGQKT